MANGTSLPPADDPANIGNYINSIAWSPDGSQVAVAGGAGIVGIVSKSDCSLQTRLQLSEAAGWLCWPSDEHLLWFGNSEVRAIDPDSGRTIEQINARVAPLQYDGWPTKRALHFVNEHTIRFVSADGQLSEMDLLSGATNAGRPLQCEPLRFSPDGEYLAGDQGLIRRLWRTSDCAPVVSFLATNKLFLISPEGHIWTRHQPGEPRRRWTRSEGIEEMFVYVVKTPAGQQTLTPLEFANRFDWQNDPSKVRLK